MKKLLIIGGYLPEYPRNRCFLMALRACFDVTEKQVGEREYLKFVTALFRYGKHQDYVWVMQPAQRFVLILFLFRFFFRVPIIFDAFTSIYDTFVEDRKLAGRYSIKAIYYYLLDFFSCRAAHSIVCDTKEHEQYFRRMFHVGNAKRFLILPVTIDCAFIDAITPEGLESVFPKQTFNVLFYGNYIPLQGIEYIIRAAHIIKNETNIHFTLIGAGQTRPFIESLYKELRLKNITFIDRMSYTDLIRHIKSSDICLGIFGNTEKARRVIPNKVLDCMACGKVVITGKNPEMARNFQDGVDIIFCTMADENDLAEKIFDVYTRHKTMKDIEKNAYATIKQKFSIENLEEKIRYIL
ncbi:MAG TPA: hypothetical protein DCY48_04630 [Candidatus Magasanikbacteria bacterium]|nr:MAG: hypothetical protein A3I74_03120 [Candidatus Magasanikbacteria bacterium RIFCSPLOWO2_02_FULL_47_16]OGH80203.1 MAG: hypothetical protein A3C10_03400 [Candidatus Magasanikbacteria bacterium RIFCSPHIGHO2_02_FULL_48_18]HAZ29027.1 hypothetical protein [Candidatus Magasanikbacteria bacterium]